MHDLNNLLLLAVILCNFFTMGSNRLGACIRVVALQGAIISILPVTVHGPTWHTLLLGGGALALKGIFIPWLLFRAIREVRIRREVEPLIGYIPTLLIGALRTSAAFIFAEHLPLVAEHRDSLFIPTALATLFTGFLLLSTRRKAITQVLGYIVMENGIFALGMVVVEAMPLLVELGVLLDIFVAVFVMGIIVFHIQREFDHIDVSQLDALREEGP